MLSQVGRELLALAQSAYLYRSTGEEEESFFSSASSLAPMAGRKHSADDAAVSVAPRRPPRLRGILHRQG